MFVTWRDRRFICYCRREEAGAPRAAGFQWDGKARAWWTATPETAEKLRHLWDARVHRVFEVIAERRRIIEESRAVDASIEIPAPDGCAYLGYQKAGIKFGASRPNILLADDMGLGKQQPVDTPVLTPFGWRPIGSLKIGDEVIGSNGQATKVNGVFPQGVKPSYCVTFSDGANVEAGPEHLWTLRYRRGGKAWHDLTLTTEQLRARPVIGKLNLSRLPLYLPMLSAPVQFAGMTPPPVHPYLVGLLLANGYLGGSSPVLTMHVDDYEHVAGALTALGFDLGARKHYEGNACHFLIRGVVAKLRAIGLVGDSRSKRIPALYMYASPENRQWLLNGLMDGDGSVSQEKNRLTYHTINRVLAGQVKRLVEGLGGIASVREYVRIRERKPTDYQVRLRLPEWSKPFTVPRKACRYNPGSHALPVRTLKSVEFVRDVESVCIAVDAPDQLYVTKDCILTHNTIQALGIINLDSTIRRVLVVCPASLKLNWRREARKWLCNQDLSIGVAEGPHFPSTDLVIINYDILERHRAALIAREWDLLCVDECHYVKNPKARRTKALLGGMMNDADGKRVRWQAIPAKRKVFMTGTPIVNRPSELWTVIHALDPERWKNWKAYVSRYCDAVETRFGWNTAGNSNLDELQRILRSTIMVRRLKCDVLTDLPPKSRQVIEFPCTPAMRKLIEQESNEYKANQVKLTSLQEAVTRAQVSKDEEGYRFAVRSLNQAMLVEFAALSRVRHLTAVAKLPYVIEHIRECLESVPKIVVFAHHKDVLFGIQKEFRDSVLLFGETGLQARDAAVQRFQNDPGVRLFIGGIIPAGVGITLTAASHVIFAELDWVPGNVTQAEDRCHRIGQRDNVLVQHLVLEGSLDAYMAQVIIRKQEVIEQALNSANAPKAPKQAIVRPVAYQP